MRAAFRDGSHLGGNCAIASGEMTHQPKAYVFSFVSADGANRVNGSISMNDCRSTRRSVKQAGAKKVSNCSLID